jgi:hypothetical protein
MTAITKVESSPLALFGIVQWNIYKDWGKEISMMGMIDFGLEKKFEQFFVHQRFSPFSKSRVSILTVLHVNRIGITLNNLKILVLIPT